MGVVVVASGNHMRCAEMLTQQIGNPSLSESGIWLPRGYEITCQT